MMPGDEDGELVVEIEAPDAPQEQAPEPAEAAQEPAEAQEVEQPRKPLSKYGEDVQRRIGRVIAKRAAAEARAEEAERRARELEEELARLRPAARQAFDEGLEAKIADAYRRAEDAFNAGDIRKGIEAQAEVAEYRIRKQSLQYAPQQQEYRQPDPEPDIPTGPPERAREWVKRNSWFNSDATMRKEAIAMSNALEAEGYDPHDEDYYAEIDRRLATRFPERFRSSEPARSAPAQAMASPVAPVGRSAPSSEASSRRPGQIRLSRDEAQMARDLGVSPQAYARMKMQNGVIG